MLTATGWIGLHDDGISVAETEAGANPEASWCPSRKLEDFFGLDAKFTGFHLEKYLGLCVPDFHLFLICTDHLYILTG
jgi:hypothetical protein